MTKTCSAQNHWPMLCKHILLCKCFQLLVLLPSCAFKPGVVLVSFAMSHSTTALRETIATSTEDGGFKLLKNSRNEKVAKGLPIVCIKATIFYGGK